MSCLPALAATGPMEDRSVRTRTLVFDCARGGFTAILLLDNATILLADRGSTLQRVAGAAAETFADGVSRFWTDGATATLTMPGAELTEGQRRRIFGPLRPCSGTVPAPCWIAGEPWDLRLAALDRRPAFELRLRTAGSDETRSPALGRRLGGP